jgi:hypothetical protein
MQEKEFDQKLLADILAYSVNYEFCDYDKYRDICYNDDDEIAKRTKQDIIQLAKTLLDEDEFNSHPEFKIKKPDLFSKLDDATNEAKASLEAKREILHQICLNVMEEFPTLKAVKIESVEYGIIKVTHSDKQVENSTYIAINDEEQLKLNVQEFLGKIETKKGKQK